MPPSILEQLSKIYSEPHFFTLDDFSLPFILQVLFIYSILFFIPLNIRRSFLRSSLDLHQRYQQNLYGFINLTYLRQPR